jgi:hypothetical protein
MEDTGRNEVEHELPALHEHGMAGVVSALVARHGREVRREHVHDLALALVTPLRAEHGDVRLRHSGIS